MINRNRMTARIDGDFAVFLIGMRINNPLLIHKWLPVVTAMPRRMKELYQRPELGLLSHEIWFGRTIIIVQYWRSMDDLLHYAKSKDLEHLPAWQKFNKSVGTSGDVGIWHETYLVGPGSYENIYANMPAFGLGKAGTLLEAKSGLKSATERLKN